MQPAFQRLQNHLSLNQLSNAFSFACAVGDSNGAADFYYHPSTQIASSAGLSSDFYRPWAEFFTKMTVPVVTLDEFVREQGIEHVDLMKIDVESYEPQVLHGAKTILQCDQPIIICEVLKGCGTERALEEILRPYGYRFYLLTPSGPVERKNIEGHEAWLNYLFVTGDSQIDKLF